MKNSFRHLIRLLLFVILPFLVVSCNTGEGPGGTGAIEGTVYMVLHPDDNFNMETDTVLAAKEDVFLVYGTSQFYGDDEDAYFWSSTMKMDVRNTPYSMSVYYDEKSAYMNFDMKFSFSVRCLKNN